MYFEDKITHSYLNGGFNTIFQPYFIIKSDIVPL